MSALTAPRNTKEIYCNAMSLHRIKTVAAGSTIHLGSIVAVNASGYAVPASDSAGLTVIGRAETFARNSRIICKTGVYAFANGSGAEALSAADINRVCYVLDDQTVGKAGGSHRIPAGIVRDYDNGSVVVELGTLPDAASACVKMPVSVSADPTAASPANRGSLIIIGTGWTSGTAIATAVTGEVYLSNGSAWVKLG